MISSLEWVLSQIWWDALISIQNSENRQKFSRLRQSLRRLSDEARKLIEPSFSHKTVIKGSVYELKRKAPLLLSKIVPRYDSAVVDSLRSLYADVGFAYKSRPTFSHRGPFSVWIANNKDSLWHLAVFMVTKHNKILSELQAVNIPGLFGRSIAL